VNVSARRLLDLTFPNEVAAALATWEVPARLLVVEITESTIMADPAHALEVLGRLNEMGVQLSIDDSAPATPRCPTSRACPCTS
jgi:diguanylate cyclase